MPAPSPQRSRLGAALLVCAVAAGCAHSTYGDPAVPVAGTVLGTVVHTRDAEELRYVVLRELTDRYAREQGIVVTQAEKDAYVRHVQEGLAKDRAEKATKRDDLARGLAAPDLTAAQRKALAAELDAVNRFLADLGDPRLAGKADSEENQARQQIAAAFIRQWKINRALYRQFGGRVIFQQGGPEPLDAYRLFLEEHQARGDFRITNTDLVAPFWRYYRNDGIHSFYPPGSREEAQAFAVPWWQSK